MRWCCEDAGSQPIVLPSFPKEGRQSGEGRAGQVDWSDETGTQPAC